MSIQWNWEHHMGKVEVRCTDNSYLDLDIYHPNCWAVIIHNVSEKEYRVVSFFIDREHAKNCIKAGVLDDFRNWRLNTKYKDALELAKLLVKEGEAVTIYNSDSKVPWELQN